MEAKLWARIRNRQLAGLKFRRQQVIGPYIADFVCASEKVVVELDGVSHELAEAYDAERTEFLASIGYRVLRFTNEQVRSHIDAVLAEIAKSCGVEI